MLTEFEARTNRFVSQNVDTVADQLLAGSGMVLIIPGTDRMIRLLDDKAYAKLRSTAGKEAIGERYKSWGIDSLNLGDLWNPPSHGKRQSLVISQDQDGIGACVRLLAASYWDPSVKDFVKQLTIGGEEYKWNREGDIARYFGLRLFERSVLRFMDATDTLSIVRAGQIHKTDFRRTKRISSDEANEQLLGLLED